MTSMGLVSKNAYINILSVATGIYGRVTAASTGYIGESLNTSITSGTFSNTGTTSGTYGDLSTPLNTPILSAGIWLIIVNGGGLFNTSGTAGQTGGVGAYRITDSNSTVLELWSEVFVNLSAGAGQDMTVSLSTIYSNTAPASVHFQPGCWNFTGGNTTTFSIRNPMTIRAQRIA